MTATTGHRWAEISSAVAAWHDRMLADHDRAWQIAAQFGNALRTYLGVPDKSYVELLSYSAGYDADSDKYETVEHPTRAVSRRANDGRWVFGLGILLERSPGAFPKFNIHLPVTIALGEQPVINVGGEGPLKHSINIANGRYDFEEVCAETYAAIKGGLEKGAKGETPGLRIGFIEVK
jgi:hypothetical protein